MARYTITADYLKELGNKGYKGYNNLLYLYNKWKEELDIKVLSSFLDIIWKEKDSIRPRYLGVATYSNFRGIAFEEFCVHLLNKVNKEIKTENIIDVFWNAKILTEEFHIFENGQFRKFPKYKAVDIALGKREDKLIHPLIIISCKIWQCTNWLDEDKAVLENIKNRYPDILGYSLCMSLSVSPVSLISSRRIGLRVVDFSTDGKIMEFISEIKEILKAVKKTFNK